MELANCLIQYQTYYNKKLTGVKNYTKFDFIPLNKLHLNTAETLHCTNQNADILSNFLHNEKNDIFLKNLKFRLDEEAVSLNKKHINKNSNEFLDSYVQTVEKVKTRAKICTEYIERIFPQKTPTKRLDAKKVLIAIKENRFDFKTGNILEKPDLLHKLASKKPLRQGLASFLAKYADEVNPDKYLDYCIDKKGFLKWYNVLSRKIIHFLKNH